MGQTTLGAAGRGMALALALTALGCSRPLATLEMFEPATAPSGLQQSATEPTARSRSVVAIAKRHVGVRYAWGGADPAGFDCSGFVMYVYAHLGVSLPHNAAKQYQYGSPVTRKRLEPGDVVFFDGLRHNGIYVGDGRFIHARRSGRGVIISGLDESWYRTRWVGGRRFWPRRWVAERHVLYPWPVIASPGLLTPESTISVTERPAASAWTATHSPGAFPSLVGHGRTARRRLGTNWPS